MKHRDLWLGVRRSKASPPGVHVVNGRVADKLHLSRPFTLLEFTARVRLVTPSAEPTSKQGRRDGTQLFSNANQSRFGSHERIGAFGGLLRRRRDSLSNVSTSHNGRPSRTAFARTGMPSSGHHWLARNFHWAALPAGHD
jgi:hypothetical protein